MAGLISALLVVRPLRPSGVHATPRLRAFTLPTMAANFQSSSLPARLLVSAVDGHADQESAGIRDTIHDVPLPVLTGGGEFAMILIRDDEVSGRAGSPCDQMARLRNVNGYHLSLNCCLADACPSSQVE